LSYLCTPVEAYQPILRLQIMIAIILTQELSQPICQLFTQKIRECRAVQILINCPFVIDHAGIWRFPMLNSQGPLQNLCIQSQPENLFVATCFSASWSHNNLWALPELGFRGSALHSKLLSITSVLSNAIEAHRTS
jgi:hypothetical protein